MKYELAKELKDAGFPQSEECKKLHTPICGNFDNPDPECTTEGRPCEPTLSELIEACGDGVFELKRRHNEVLEWVWDAGINHNGKFFIELGGVAPEEAVANLWLALNKKL